MHLNRHPGRGPRAAIADSDSYLNERGNLGGACDSWGVDSMLIENPVMRPLAQIGRLASGRWRFSHTPAGTPDSH